MQTFIKNVLDDLDQDNTEDPQFRWEYSHKYEIRKLSICSSKETAQKMKTEKISLENRLKTLKSSTNFVENPVYTKKGKTW